MTSIEVSIDLSAGTAQVSGPISNADNVQLVLKGYAENVTDGSRVRIVRGCRELITGGIVTVSGDNGVCLINTNSDEVKKLAESMRCPSQVGVEIVVDDTEDESVKASGRALLLLNWVEVGGGGVGGGSGGGTVQDGAVPITNIDELPSRYRESDMRNKINEIARVISGRAVSLALILAPFALFGAGVNVYTAQKDQVWNDERIVTNVTFDAEGLVTSLEAATNYVDSATNALSASLSEKISDSSESATNYTDSAVADLDESFSDKIVEVSSESKSYTDMATNALAAKIPVVDLEPYATKSWVEANGYLTADSIDGVATKAWVGDQGYLTALALTPYATIDWVLGRNYVTASVTNDLASKSWVEERGYATTGWIERKGYVTESITNDLAEKAWVMERGFATESITNGLASKSWVDSKRYLTIDAAKRVYATKDEIGALKRMYADTNGVTRIWSDDGFTMTDGTGVVWDVTWNAVTNWISLSNGVVFAQTFSQMEGAKWVSQGIYTNTLGQSSSASIFVESETFSIVLDAHSGSAGTFEVLPGQILVEAHEYGYNDTFSNSTYRIPAFAFRSRIVTNDVGYVTGGGIDTNAVLGLITSATNEFATAVNSKADEFTEWITTNLPAGVTITSGPEWSELDGRWKMSTSDGLLWEGISAAEDAIFIQWYTEAPPSAPISTRTRVLRTGDADKLTSEQKTMLDGGPYLPLSGGTLNDGATIKLNSLGASIGGGPTDGTVYIEARGSSSPGVFASGAINLRAKYVRKNNEELATEEQVNAKADKTNVYTKAEVDAKVENAVLPTNPTFSNAVLSVGLNIDTNSVAVLNDIAKTFGGFPIGAGETATTIGGLLAALAAAAAWLRKNKVGSFASVGGASATVENGVAKLDDFFTESNSLLTGRVNNLIDAKVGDVNAVLAAALDGSEVA